MMAPPTGTLVTATLSSVVPKSLVAEPFAPEEERFVARHDGRLDPEAAFLPLVEALARS